MVGLRLYNVASLVRGTLPLALSAPDQKRRDKVRTHGHADLHGWWGRALKSGVGATARCAVRAECVDAGGSSLTL
eukprot:scaffold48974_cov55-Phaeocystis_antarctica.AAC.1